MFSSNIDMLLTLVSISTVSVLYAGKKLCLDMLKVIMVLELKCRMCIPFIYAILVLKFVG